MSAWFWTILLFVITLICVYAWQIHTYWSKRGIKTGIFIPFLGHMVLDALKKNKFEHKMKDYLKVKSEKYRGMYQFTKPVLLLYDLDLVKLIMVKDADSFQKKTDMSNDRDGPHAKEFLFMLGGEEGKALRSIISPIFSSGKIKLTFSLIVEKADLFFVECEKFMKEKSFVQIQDLVNYYTLDIIGTVALGVDTMCLQKKLESPLVKEMKKMATEFTKIHKMLLLITFPKLAAYFGISMFYLPFTKKIVEKVLSERQASNSRRGDFLDFFLDALNEHGNGKSGKYNMTLDTVKAQAIMFLLGGFDTVGTTVTLIIYSLAKYTAMQEKLRLELTKLKKKSGELTYQDIMEAPYLDAVISETMRRYPVAVFSERICSSDYRLPGTDLVIEDGTTVNIPIYYFHHDSDYWDHPYEFDPERFMPENKAKIVPFSYMPFAMGPRNCVAMRFALLEMKVLIAKLAIGYKFSLKPGFEIQLVDNGMLCRADDKGVEIIMNKIE